MKDVVKVVFEMPRDEFAKFKYLYIKRNIAIKEVLGNAAREITEQFLDEEFGKQEDRTHEFPAFSKPNGGP